MIKPYYETDLGTLYLGDCLEILPQLTEKVDLVLTDPPYGITADEAQYKVRLHNIKTISKKKASSGWKYYGKTAWDKQRPNSIVFHTLIHLSKNQIIWGGNYFADILPPTMGWLVWNKGQRNFSLADGELAWTSFQNALRIFDYPRAKIRPDERVHPTQKATFIMIKSIQYADRHGGFNDLVLDPFLGSGTTAMACERLDRRWIGIEISKEYCDIAVRRIERERAQLKLPL